jgi:hypothetical protein
MCVYGKRERERERDDVPAMNKTARTLSFAEEDNRWKG